MIGAAVTFTTRANDDPADELRALAEANARLRIEIAERERAELILRTAMHNYPQGAFIIVDHDMRYVFADGEELVATGFPSEKLIGRTIYEVLPPESLIVIEKGFKSALEGETLTFERHSMGGYYLTRFAPVRDMSGVIIYAMSTVHNLTELVEVKRAKSDLQDANALLNISLEELRAANQEVQRFTYIISHDLRAPLVSLTGFSQLLREAIEHVQRVITDPNEGLSADNLQALDLDLNDTIPAALKYIGAAIQRLDTLTTSILKLSRFGRHELRLEQVDVHVLVNGILDSMASRLQERGLRVVIGELAPIVADRTALDTIFGNLIDNATKYLEPSRIGFIEITAEQGDIETIYHVRDNGRGISDRDREKVFEPFRRGDVIDVDGEGMGLAYVQALLRRLGGRIDYETQPGEGTTFSFALPHRALDRDAVGTGRVSDRRTAQPDTSYDGRQNERGQS
ncbi:MAG: ATP-binding protein [Chloroflexota bacterium]|nr:ATP-binding protein [Chloroflexota bacterium]